MFVYLFGFFLSLFFVYLSQKNVGKISSFLIVLGIVIPCAIAGFRDPSIGTDVQVYVKPLFERAKESANFLEYYNSNIYYYSWRADPVKTFEIGYLVLNYIIAKLFGVLWVMLFAIHAIIIIPLYKALKLYSNKFPLWIGMATFYFMFYNRSLNVMRQWMALSLLFYAFHYLQNKNYLKYSIFVLFSILFHNSAVVGFGIMLIYIYVNNKQDSIRIFNVFIIIGIGLACLLGTDIIVNILVRIGIVEYSSYISGDVSFLPSQIILRFPLIILFVYDWRRLKSIEKDAYIYLIFVIFDILTSQLSSVNQVSGRIALFFSMYNILIYPQICTVSKFKNNNYVRTVYLMGYLFLYWWVQYVYMGYNATVPYISIFQ